MIDGKVILAPTQDSSATSTAFDVDKCSRVVWIAPDSGETLTDDDAFELRRVVDTGPVRSVKLYDSDGNAILLGANQPQFEIMIRGTYLVQKILATTESVGVYQTYGAEDGL